MEKSNRTRSAEYRISFVSRRNETYIYIGSMWAGRIMHDHVSTLHKVEKFGVFLQLPGMWGPVARADNLNLARFAATEAIKRWLDKFTDTPEPPPEQLVRTLAKRDKAEASRVEEAPKRVRRTRAVREPAPAVRRVSRSR